MVDKETVRATNVLFVLANDGPLNKYRIWKRLANRQLGTEPTILDTIWRLEYTRCIEVKRIEKNARGPKPSKYYDLTIRGLTELVGRLNCLRLKPSDVNSLHRHLAQKYRELIPDVFSLWPEIIEAKIEDLAQKRLQVFSGRFIRDERHRMYGKSESVPAVMPSPPTSAFINRWFFLSPDPFAVFQDDESVTRWLNAIANNPVLRDAFKKTCCNSLRWSLGDFKSQIDLFNIPTEEKSPELEDVRHKCSDLMTSLDLLLAVKPLRDQARKK